MGKKNIKYMNLKNKNILDATIYDKSDLNIVYTPRIFQNHQKSFDESYLFVIPPFSSQIKNVEIPYEKMKSPIIYISLGSIISNRGFCKMCIRAFRDTEFTVILNTGRVDLNSLGKIPKNIFPYSFVPQIEVLKKTDIFLSHCGMNSINEALCLAVPMIAMPFMNDQISNAKRLVELGIAKRVRSFPSRGKDIYKAAKSIINDKKIKNNCIKLRESLQKDNDFINVINKIENLLAN